MQTLRPRQSSAPKYPSEGVRLQEEHGWFRLGGLQRVLEVGKEAIALSVESFTVLSTAYILVSSTYSKGQHSH